MCSLVCAEMRSPDVPVRYAPKINEDAVCPVLRGGAHQGSPFLRQVGRQMTSSTSGAGAPPLDLDDAESYCSDRASLAEELSLPSSPAASCQSELVGESSPVRDFAETQRRTSFDLCRVDSRKPPVTAQGSFQRKNFLPRNQMGLTHPQRSPDVSTPPGGTKGSSGSGAATGAGSGSRSGSGNPLFLASPGQGGPPSPQLASPSRSQRRSGPLPLQGQGQNNSGPQDPSGRQPAARPPHSPGGGSHLFQPYRAYSGSTMPPHQQQARGPAIGEERRRSFELGLREQVLVQSSARSGELTPKEPEGEDCFDSDAASAECLNFEDAESMCQEKELEKDQVEGLLIVPLPSSMAAKDGPEFVLYALFFSSDSSTPTLPGDESIKLLFPQELQNLCLPKVDAKLKESSFIPGNSFRGPAASKPAVGGFATFGEFKPVR